ncbi:MAG TPA: coniferyl aldehyde dehydrogenase [Noviherbaspirillum sp.]|uniref:coniferyl aldehyde dehydrogenase n=1 Tax=Noviherbaspirillum sp. TaxID=1926288 RepID=UPI002B47B082|nr:coniferyl aldehyde dehydrogenase [Noviherbaspirillum sp.]HJV84423.1 coniferyl aldehyde dehydrogenase [Noviherbaspirillum sp.]
MIDRADFQEPQPLAHKRLSSTFDAQKQAFGAHPFPEAEVRRAALSALRHQIGRYQDALAEAMHRDFGNRAPAESKMLDLLGSVLEIDHARKHVKRWMRPSRRATEFLFFSNSLQVMYQPKGVIGVIVPWNFPVYLALGPLAAALAAGNRVMIKMSEVTPATNAVMKQLLGEIFQEDHVAVFGEELADPNLFTSLPFDHVVFTGSPAIGRIVMRAAADNLTPVTLELGGKSPALVTRNYPIADAARRIAHGKSVNGGQICVAPDYALVPRERLDAFVDGVKAAFSALYPTGDAMCRDVTSIVNERHHARVLRLLEDAKAKGAKVESCAGTGTGRQVALHIVTGVTAGMALMQEEIFGPVLPVQTYDDIEDAISCINAGPRPLALYCFSHDPAERRNVLKRTHSGGVTINDWGWHAINHDAPFGGIGNSGMGTYHGIEGFRELSHARTVFKRHRFFPIGLFYPPYGNAVQRLVLRMFLGRPDGQL